MIGNEQFPPGDSITGSPHSVCVSLPTMADVIAYEEKSPTLLAQFKAGYPRFFRNPLIQKLETKLEEEGLLQSGDSLLPSSSVAEDLADFLRLTYPGIYKVCGFYSLRLNRNAERIALAQQYLQHTGNRISSREAEASLEELYGWKVFSEDRVIKDAEKTIKAHLHSIYETYTPDDIYLFRGGMNAFYAGFRALQIIQLRNNKDVWIQLGWLYVDTAKILQKWSIPDADSIQVLNVHTLDELKDAMAKAGSRVAGIVTEVPTNPLVETPDIEELRSLANKYRAALILDPTLVSPHNVNVLQHADLHINSLTKYAAREADVLVGAAALNGDSPFYDDLRQIITTFGCAPSLADLSRLAFQINHYGETIEAINERTPQVVQFLESHPAVKKVYWAKAQPGAYKYNWIQHRSAGAGAIISFSLNIPLAHFYDRVRLVKSPSFGARFTMLCPFMYLAHYDLVSTKEGRAFLDKLEIPADLVRLSVGTEEIKEIIAELEYALKED